MPKAVQQASAELDAAARALGWIYASVVPHALSVERVGRVLSRAEITPSKGPVDRAELDRASEALIAAGLAERREEGVAAVSETALVQLRQALAGGRLGTIVDALIASRQQYSNDRFEEEAQLRGALLADDAARFARARESYRGEKVDWSFLAHAFAADVVSRLPPPDLDDALADCLAESVDRLLPIDPVIAASVQGKDVRHLDWIGYARLLQGRYDEFETWFGELPLEARRAKEARFAQAATRALAATLHGNDDGALLHIEEALGILTGGRKRFVCPNSRTFDLALLSLVRTDLPESRELLDKIVAARTWRDAQTWEFELVERAMAIKAKRAHWIGRYRPAGTLHVLFRSLVDCWLGDARKWRCALQALRAKAAASGFAWVAAECDAVLRSGADDTSEAPGHRRLGTATLATLLAPRLAPRRALRLLARIAGSLEDEDADAAKDEAERRLV